MGFHTNAPSTAPDETTVSAAPASGSHERWFHAAAQRTYGSRRAQAAWLTGAAALTALVLVVTASGQIYDTNFQTLWEGAAVLAGDHPYRDFYEWGLPLQAALSALAQVLSGHRLVGEFLMQWTFIVAGMVIAFDLGVRISRSIGASLATWMFALLLLAGSITTLWPKLLLYPAAIWLSWWYMERPTTRRSALLGLLIAIAFLMRHDHGLYIGVAVVLAFASTRLAAPSFRNVRALAAEIASCAVVAAAIVAPWAILVHLNEGLPEYVRRRAEFFADYSAKGFIYTLFPPVGPLRAISPDPEAANALAWLQQTAVVVPVLVLIIGGARLVGGHRRNGPIDATAYPLVVAAAFLLVVESQTLRHESYVLGVVPVVTALSAWLAAATATPGGRLWSTARAVLVGAFIVVTGVATARYIYTTPSDPRDLVEAIGPTFRELVAVPPIDGLLTAESARQLEPIDWREERIDQLTIAIRYVHDCTRDGDRLLVTGSTPYHVSYYTKRLIAGGHLHWHNRWRSDPAGEAHSLAMLQRQPVPFAVSTTDPVLEDFKRYPKIHEYLVANYQEIEGSRGRLLVDKRRARTGEFGRLGFPCFR